jgi:putative phage terminase, large subunit
MGLRNNKFPLSQKYIDFINSTNVSADFLEGTTASGKTTVGAGVKFMRMVSKSSKKLHIIASKTTGTAEKNIIQQDNGILDLHRGASYYGNGDKDYKIPHIKFENKIIFVLGYDNRDKWELVLGSQFGCVYIDEINTAHIDFVREISTRNDYLMATLNPDDPSLPIYKEFVNRSRPYKKYENIIPNEIREELKEKPVQGWKYWFFTFEDNLSLTAADIEKKKQSAPTGTKLYKNKILGLRGRATGLVFPNFDRRRHIIPLSGIKQEFKTGRLKFRQFSIGIDTAYSQKSSDTIAMLFLGISTEGVLYILDERVYNNRDLAVPRAPSDTIQNIIDFADRNKDEWGLARNIFIDSADQATLMEANKYKRYNPCLYSFFNAYKKTKITDRITMQLGWFQTDCYFVADCCIEHIKELEIYSWDESKDNTPEDRHDHTINASQYGWLPFIKLIGYQEKKTNEVDGESEE